MNSEENQLLSENSDEDDLPDLGGGSSDSSEKKFEIAQHDIVWAEFRNLYWPALVRCVKKKERKASIWYLDSPRKCFKVPFKKIKSFSDPKMTELVKCEVESSPMKAKHKRVWLNAITYIRRKTQGYNDDPAIYFDLSKHYLAYKDKELDEKYSGEIENGDAILKISDSDTALSTKNDDTSDEESLVSDDEEENVIDKKLSIFTNLDESYQDGPEVDNIVKCIAAGHVDKHLLRIKSKKVPSHYQELYEDAMQTNKQKLLYITPGDHVKSTKKLKEIAIYLMNYYEKVIEGGKCEMVNYVLYVWVPEAINIAVELIKKGSINLSKAIPESRRRLFPTDELVNGKMYDPIASCRDRCGEEAKSKKCGRPKSNKKTQQKKVKESANEIENKLTARYPSEKGIKSTVESPNKKQSKVPAKLPTSKKKSKVLVKSPSIKEIKSPSKKESKSANKLSTRTSPRKKVQ